MLPTPDTLKWASLLQETLQQLAKLEERMLRLEDCLNSQAHMLKQMSDRVNYLIDLQLRDGDGGLRKPLAPSARNKVTRL